MTNEPVKTSKPSLPLDKEDINHIVEQLSAKQGLHEVIHYLAKGEAPDEEKDMLRESFYIPDQVRRQINGWRNIVSDSFTGYDIPDNVRIRIVKLARTMNTFVPLVSHAVDLFTNFSIGQGIKFSTAPLQGPDRQRTSRAETVFRNFHDNLANRCFFSLEGQQNMVERYMTDGEVFLALFFPAGDNGSRSVIRTINPLEIHSVVTNPEDDQEVWFYVRRFTTQGGKERTLFYKDWTWQNNRNSVNVDALGIGLGAEIEGLVPANGNITFQPARIYSIREGLGRRGVSPLAASLPWANAHRKFMEARMNVTAAIARYARRMEVDANKDQLSTLKSAMESGIRTTSDYDENNPAPTPGSTFLHNTKVKDTIVPQETGADAAKVDGNMLIAMFCIGIGLFPHYCGAGEAFRLATATAMEPPMRKLFVAFQTKWEQVYKDIIMYLYAQSNVPDRQQFIRVDFPEVWQQDVPALIESLARVFQSAPWLAEIDEVVLIILMHLGIEDPRALWDRIGDNVKKRIEKMNDARVIGPNGGQQNASASDDSRRPQPGDDDDDE